jgi:hypothetical protein
MGVNVKNVCLSEQNTNVTTAVQVGDIQHRIEKGDSEERVAQKANIYQILNEDQIHLL